MAICVNCDKTFTGEEWELLCHQCWLDARNGEQLNLGDKTSASAPEKLGGGRM